MRVTLPGQTIMDWTTTDLGRLGWYGPLHQNPADAVCYASTTSMSRTGPVRSSTLKVDWLTTNTLGPARRLGVYLRDNVLAKEFGMGMARRYHFAEAHAISREIPCTVKLMLY